MSNIETRTIKPTNKHHFPSLPPSLSLHGIDLIAGPCHISNHRFFHNNNNNNDDIITTLTSSLAEALEYYPPVAGTVRMNEKEGKPYISLDGEGALFIIEKRETKFEEDGDDVSPRPEAVLPFPSKSLAVKLTLVFYYLNYYLNIT